MKKLITPHDAYVVQGARLISEPVLSEILKDLSLTRQERILAFLYIYHFITKEQCMRLCHSCILPNTSLGNTLRRMCESGLVTPCVNNEKDISGKNIYRIRKKGIFAGETLFRSKLIELLNKEGTFSYFFKFICGNNGVTIDECLRYLSDRCINFMNRTSSAHTLGVNDVTLALLPDRSYNPPVLYTREREAFCDKSGMFVSIYEKTYRNLNLKSGAVRCDALLNFYFLSDRATLEVCIEQDTGSQHPAVITEKIEKYFDHIFRARLKNSSTSSRLPLLIFTISENKEIPSEDRQRLTGTDNLNPRVMYLAQGIEMIGSIYRAEKNVTYLSLYELSAYVEDLLMPLTEKKRILSFLDECIAKVGGQTEIYNLRTALGIKVKNAPLGKQALYDFYANKHYYSRRNMILKAVDKIPKAIDLMYHGASLCNVISN